MNPHPHCFYKNCPNPAVVKIRSIPPDDAPLDMELCRKDYDFYLLNASGCRVVLLAKYLGPGS